MKFLIIGLGSIGKRHARNLKSLGYDDIIAFRSRPEKLDFCEKNSIIEYFSLKEAINQKPDVVFLTNPTSLHVSVALKILEKVKTNLFIEKPISNSLEGLDRLCEEVEAKNVVTMVGYNMRFHPLLKKIKKILIDEQIGEIVAYRSIWGEYLPNWHPWENYREGYSARDDLGGGALLTLSHDIDMVLWFFGRTEKIQGLLSEKKVLETTSDECSILTLKHKNNIIGSLFFDYLQDPPKRSLEIIAKNGKILWDYYENSLTVFERSTGQQKVFKTAKGFERNDMFIDEIQHFLNCIENKQKPLVTIANGIDVLKIALEVRKNQ